MRSICVLLSFLVTSPLLAQKAGPIPDYPAKQITSRSYVIEGPLGRPSPENQGFMNNPGIVLTSKGAVIIDPGASVQSGEMVLRQLRKITPAPVVAVFNTHVHGDHWLGNQAVRDAFPEAPIYAHPRTIQQVTEGAGAQWRDLLLSMTEGATAGTEVVAADQAKDDGDEITIGDTRFRIHYTAKAHSNTDLMIEIPSEKLIFLGDNGLNGRLGQMSNATFKGNIASLETALATGSQVFVPGHGAAGGVEAATGYLNYLRKLRSEVTRLFDEGLADFEIKDALLEQFAAYHNWVGFDDEFGRHVSLVYLEVEQENF